MVKGICLALGFGAWITVCCLAGYYGATAICKAIDKVTDKE